MERITIMWNSLEILSKFQSFLQGFVAAVVFITAVATIFSFILGARISSLQKEKDFQLRKQINQLESEQIGRRLNTEQRKLLADSFAQIPKIKLSIIGIQGNRESILFAKNIYGILKDIGWDVEGVNEEIYLGGVGFGMIIKQKRADLPGEKISRIFTSLGFQSKLLIKPDMDENIIEIIVAHKP